MTRILIYTLLVVLISSVNIESHDLADGQSVIDPERTIQIGKYVIKFDITNGSLIKIPPSLDRESYLKDAEFGVFFLTNKETGYHARYDFILDGSFAPSFQVITSSEYCGVSVLMVTVKRSTPRYGGGASRWLTTYVFRADTFEMLTDFDGTVFDVTRFDSRWVPEVDSVMDERYLVSCFPAGRHRPFDFGLIDRKALYGPDWCGPQGWRCRVNAP